MIRLLRSPAFACIGLAAASTSAVLALAAPASTGWASAGVSTAGVAPLYPAAAPDICEDCRQGKACKSHRALDKAEIKRLGPELESEDKEVRLKALGEVAALSEEHENAPTKEAAEVLVRALEDDQLVVQRAAFQWLASGQHPETAVTGYVARLKWFQGNMWSLVADMTGPGGKHGSAGEAMDVLETAVGVGKELRDDRVVTALSGLLNAFPTEMRGEPIAMSASRALLYLGTKDAVEAVIKQFGSQSDVSKMRSVHFALKTFANRLEIEVTPEFGDNVEGDWKGWFRKNARRIPKKLGKWTGPEPEVEDDDA